MINLVPMFRTWASKLWEPLPTGVRPTINIVSTKDPLMKSWGKEAEKRCTKNNVIWGKVNHLSPTQLLYIEKVLKSTLFHTGTLSLVTYCHAWWCFKRWLVSKLTCHKSRTSISSSSLRFSPKMCHRKHELRQFTRSAAGQSGLSCIQFLCASHQIFLLHHIKYFCCSPSRG